MVFVGGDSIRLNGGLFETSAGTTIFTNVGAGTANFGFTGSIPTFS
jgi:hypothetical protein